MKGGNLAVATYLIELTGKRKIDLNVLDDEVSVCAASWLGVLAEIAHASAYFGSEESRWPISLPATHCGGWFV